MGPIKERRGKGELRGWKLKATETCFFPNRKKGRKRSHDYHTRQWASDNTSNTKGGTKMKWIIASAALFITMVILSPGYTAGPPEKNIREAYKMILSQADTNKDGKLSVAECMAGYKDKSMAEKNCTFWDADKDGIITEDEYVKQGSSLGKKK
jgi:hypothetical protein